MWTREEHEHEHEPMPNPKKRKQFEKWKKSQFARRNLFHLPAGISFSKALKIFKFPICEIADFASFSISSPACFPIILRPTNSLKLWCAPSKCVFLIGNFWLSFLLLLFPGDGERASDVGEGTSWRLMCYAHSICRFSGMVVLCIFNADVRFLFLGKLHDLSIKSFFFGGLRVVSW